MESIASDGPARGSVWPQRRAGPLAGLRPRPVLPDPGRNPGRRAALCIDLTRRHSRTQTPRVGSGQRHGRHGGWPWRFAAGILAPGADRALWTGIDNSVATFIEGLIFPAVALAWANGGKMRRQRAWRIAGAALAVILAATLILTTSRGAWLAVALGALLWVGLSWRPARWPAAVILGLLVTGLGCGIAGASWIPGFGHLGAFFVRPDRLHIYRYSAYLVQDFVFTGLGLGGTYGMVLSRHALLIQPLFVTYAHQLYLQIWLSQGLLGIIAFAWLLLALAGEATRLARPGADRLSQSLWIGLVVTALHGLTDARQYQDLWCWAPFFFAVGPVRRFNAPSRRGSGAAPCCSRPARPWVLAAVAALWLAGSPLGAWQSNLGAVAQARAELGALNTDQTALARDQAAAHFERALALAPDNRTAHQRLGILLDGEDRFDAAVPELEAAYKAAPGNRTTWKALGLAYVWTGRLDQAETLLREVPDMADELHTWGNWRQSRGQIDQALAAYRVSLRLRPDQPALETVIAALEAQAEAASN